MRPSPHLKKSGKTAVIKPRRIGIAADHGGFELKQHLSASLRAAGHPVTDFGDTRARPDDDYPDFVVPLARAIACGEVDRGIAICASGVGASVAANKVAGVRACLIHETFSAHQGVEDDDLNMICLGGLVVGHAAAWELVQAFLAARFSGAERHRRRLATVAELESRPGVAGPPRLLHSLGQSLWLDNITRDLLDSGTLKRYIDELSVTGLTSNPTIFDHAIKESAAYDAGIRGDPANGKSGEGLFFDLAMDDLTRAADLFRPVYNRTNGVDGWVSLEVSPLLAHDTPRTIAAARELFARAGRPNLFIKIPGTKEGLPAIEEAIFAGVPVNVTLLFSREQHAAAAGAYLRGIERRIAAGLNPEVGSVASVFVSRWDVAVAGKVPEALGNRLGIAISNRIYKAYIDLLGSRRSQRAYNAGARPQRLLWASTGTKDPKASDTLYVTALAAPFTVNTMPEETLKALADHGEIGPAMAEDGGDCEKVLARFARAGVDLDHLAARLQAEGAKSFVKSWKELLTVIAARSRALRKDA